MLTVLTAAAAAAAVRTPWQCLPQKGGAGVQSCIQPAMTVLKGSLPLWAEQETTVGERRSGIHTRRAAPCGSQVSIRCSGTLVGPCLRTCAARRVCTTCAQPLPTRPPHITTARRDEGMPGRSAPGPLVWSRCVQTSMSRLLWCCRRLSELGASLVHVPADAKRLVQVCGHLHLFLF